jgi:hypothetical protein
MARATRGELVRTSAQMNKVAQTRTFKGLVAGIVP